MDEKANVRLVRAARELLRWDQTKLAKAAHVGVATVRRFESGAQVRADKVTAISRALREGGVAFIGAGLPIAELVEGVALTASARPLDPPEPRRYKAREKEGAVLSRAPSRPS